MIRFADLSVGDEIPERARVVTREAVKAYADVGGDQNPLHQDDAFARSAGFDGIIAHGMFTMGLLAQSIVDWIGDPSPLARLKAQFRAPVSMGETIVAGGRVKALDSETRTALLDLWVTVKRDGVIDHPVKRGEAEIRLPL